MTQSYSEYLKSPKWARIRGSVFARDEYKCQCCFQASKCVHHRRYTHEVLDGRHDCMHLLISLCEDCHEYVEFEHGVKVSDYKLKDSRLCDRMLRCCGIKLDVWEKRARSHSWSNRKKQKRQSKQERRQERLQQDKAAPDHHSKKSRHDLSREIESLRFDMNALKRKVELLESHLSVAFGALKSLSDRHREVDATPEMRPCNGT